MICIHCGLDVVHMGDFKGIGVFIHSTSNQLYCDTWYDTTNYAYPTEVR